MTTELAAGGNPGFLAAFYSFGVLIAFTAAQLAVLGLRRWGEISRGRVAGPERAER